MSERVIFARVARDDERHLQDDFHVASQLEASQYRGHMDFRPPCASDDNLLIVGGAGETVFGALSVYDAGSGKWFIDLLYVEPEAREIGIGNEMMLCVIAQLRERGVSTINAAALPGDRSTKNLFERHGLVAQMITVGKKL